MQRRWRLYRTTEPRRGWPTAAVLAVVFAVLAVVTRILCRDQAGNSSLWPANAAVVVALLVLPRRLGAATVFACFGLNVAFNAVCKYPPLQNVEMAALNIGLSVLTAFLTRTWCGAAIDLSRFRRLATFGVIAFASAGVEAWVGQMLTWTASSGASWFDVWLQWAFCDGLGLVLATPAILLAVKNRKGAHASDARMVERVLLMTIAVALAFAAFAGGHSPLYFAIYPLLVMIAFRAGPAWVLSAVLLVSLIVSALTTHGHGPLVVMSLNGGLFKQDLVQPFLVSLFLSTIPANNALGEKARAARRLGRVKASAEHGATHDALTTLVNRKLFQQRLALMLHAGTARTVFFIDLDRFKQINDTLGHEAGDELLRAFSARLLTVAPARSTVARFGGDEFAVLVGRDAEDSPADAVCAAIVEAARMPFALARGPAHVSASIGVAHATREDEDAHELMRRADIALYDAKASGRDRFRVFSDELDRVVQNRAELEADLRAALEGEPGLSLHYQLKVDRDGAAHGVEALIRWRHPRHGMIAPVRFIGVAEETGLIVPLGAWVLREAAAFATRWPHLSVAVNVSPVQLRQPGFVEETLAVLRDAALGAERIELEVTETALMDELHPATGSLDTLRKAGFKIALDDFGTGYSSLRHLHRFAVDRVKIDQSFVKSLGESAEPAAIIQAIIQLGHAMGLQVTAEGVETEEQRRFLVEAGVDELQGYLFARPVAEADLQARLSLSQEERAAA